MKKYLKYKDSSIEWIGVIPEHWDRIRIKSLVSTKVTDGPHETPEWKSEGIPFISAEAIKGNQIDLNYQRGYISIEQHQEYCKKSKVEKGDILFCKSGSTTGKAAMVETDVDFGIWSPLAIIRADKNKVNNKYLFQFIQSSLFKGQVETAWTFGTQPNIGMGALENLWIAIPTIEEQTQIANYLDYKTNQIEILIANKQKLIELLQEERTAIINQAVTKGINPKAKFKPSGVEWLGNVPEHWEIWKLSHAFDKIGSGTTPESGNPIYHENGTISWLNTGDLNDGYLDSTSKKITAKALEDYSALKKFPAGSVVIAMYGATIGKTSIVRFETTMNQACCIFYGSKIIQNEFLFYWFKSQKENIINLAKGGGQPNISQDILKSIKVPCPEIEEQNKIVKHIDGEEKRMGAIIAKVEQEIELMKEYKTALISEVVTGKVDVSTSSTEL